MVVLDPEWTVDGTQRLVAAAERFSEHHLAAAVVRGARARGLPIAGIGIVDRVGGQEVAVGNDMLFAEVGASVSAAARAEADRLRGEGKTAVYVGDALGARALVARAIGDERGIADVRADLLPEEKLVVIEELTKHGPVMMVGDGVNDAPALATATLGVAMGAGGTDVALETADVVLKATT